MDRKQHYQQHKEEYKRRNREQYLKHKEKRLDKNRERYRKKRDEILVQQRIYQQAHKKEAHEYMQKNKEKYALRSKIARDKLREDVLNHYGNQCICCGENEPKFLTIDHINGGGNKHRKSLGGPGTEIYKWIKKNDYPPDFQLLCYNCNCAKGHYGICPHQLTKD